ANEALQHVQQAYVSANLNHAGTTYLDAGKWYSPVGFENFLPSSNWNYSNSLVDNLGSPFFQFGARVYHYFNATDFLMGNVSRGWDRVGGLPESSSLGVGLSGAKQFGKLTATLNLMVSPEPDLASARSEVRGLSDLVLNYASSPKWALVLESTTW